MNDADAILEDLWVRAQAWLPWVRAKVGSAEMAEEVIQDAVVGMVVSVRGHGAPRDPAAYVAGCMRIFVNRHYRRKMASLAEVSPTVLEMVADPALDPEMEMLVRELEAARQVVAVSIRRSLDPGNREVFDLCFMAGKQNREVEQALHLNSTALRNRKHRTKRRAIELGRRQLAA